MGGLSGFHMQSDDKTVDPGLAQPPGNLPFLKPDDAQYFGKLLVSKSCRGIVNESYPQLIVKRVQALRYKFSLQCSSCSDRMVLYLCDKRQTGCNKDRELTQNKDIGKIGHHLLAMEIYFLGGNSDFCTFFKNYITFMSIYNKLYSQNFLRHSLWTHKTGVPISEVSMNSGIGSIDCQIH